MSGIFDSASKFEDGGRDVISRRKVPPSGVWTQSACRSPMLQRSTTS